MGAHSFEAWGTGWSMEEAYRKAVADAKEENGTDPYNGTISTTSGFEDVTKAYKNSKLSLDKFQDEYLDKAKKWGPALGICIDPPKTNDNKVKTTVEHSVNKGTLHWDLKFQVWECFGNRGLASFDTKGDAVAFARAHTADTKKDTYIAMAKVLRSGILTVAYVKYKISNKEHVGKYVFFGWAAC